MSLFGRCNAGFGTGTAGLVELYEPGAHRIGIHQSCETQGPGERPTAFG
jgi:hypothetical protein